MTIESVPHPEPDVAWDALEKFIGQAAVMGDGSPATTNIVTVLMVGAYIGCRLALVQPRVALAIAEAGNELTKTERIYKHIRDTFDQGYEEFLREDLQTHLHNLGFDLPVRPIADIKKPGDDAEPSAPLTDEDTKGILDGLDDLFGGGKEPA